MSAIHTKKVNGIFGGTDCHYQLSNYIFQKPTIYIALKKNIYPENLSISKKERMNNGNERGGSDIYCILLPTVHYIKELSYPTVLSCLCS